MANVREYPCGCMTHDLAGVIKFCPGTLSRSLSGRVVPRDEAAEKAHNDAMKAREDKIKLYPVADCMP